MVSILAENVSLSYPVRDHPSPQSDGEGRIEGSKKLRLVRALQNVSFTLSPGDRLGLVGRNGSGKTTLLNVLFGVYPPSSGRVVINGRMDALFNIQVGFKRGATGRRNIQLRGLINGWDARQIAERTEEIIAFSELGEFIDLPLKSYSAGMAARLAFSIATAVSPDILLMDEWIGAGDAAFQEKAKERMQQLADAAGIIVLATHNERLMKSVCNKVLELHDGNVLNFFPTIEDFAKAQNEAKEALSLREKKNKKDAARRAAPQAILAQEPISKTAVTKKAGARKEVLPPALQGVAENLSAIGDLRAELLIAEELANAGALDQSIRYLRLVARTRPRSVEIWMRLGEMLSARDLPSEAVQAVQNALQLAPQNAFLYQRMAEYLLRTGDCDRAREAQEEAVRLRK